MTAEYRKIRGNEIEPKSVHTEETDSSRFRSTYSVSFRPQQFVDHPDYDRMVWDGLRLENMLTSPTRRVANYNIYAAGENDSRSIYRTKEGGGGITKVADVHTDYQGFETVAATDRNEWLLWLDDVSGDYGTMYSFASPSDIEAGSTNGSFECQNPLDFGMTNWAESFSSRGLIWGEYGQDMDLRIIRYVHGGTFETVHTVNNSDARHFHNVDRDDSLGSNPSDFYATTGDSDGEVRWYKSTDYGATWSELSIPSDQRYRTLRINFPYDSNYVYWGSDGNGYGFYRAHKDSLDDPEELYSFKDGLYCWGSALIDQPHGILIGLKDEGNNGYDTIPMYFWDLDDEEMREVYQWEPTADNNTGVSEMGPYQNHATGYVPMKLQNIRSRNTATQKAMHVKVTQLQH